MSFPKLGWGRIYICLHTYVLLAPNVACEVSDVDSFGFAGKFQSFAFVYILFFMGFKVTSSSFSFSSACFDFNRATVVIVVVALLPMLLFGK